MPDTDIRPTIDLIADILAQYDPQLPNPRHRATVIAQALRAAGLIRG